MAVLTGGQKKYILPLGRIGSRLHAGAPGGYGGVFRSGHGTARPDEAVTDRNGAQVASHGNQGAKGSCGIILLGTILFVQNVPLEDSDRTRHEGERPECPVTFRLLGLRWSTAWNIDPQTRGDSSGKICSSS